MIFNQVYSIKIAINRCLNQRHHAVECNHCVEHCPSGAIIKNEQSLLLDKEKCSGCGLCLSDCPTQVFRSEHWDETSILQDITEEGWEITEFFCGEHSKPFKKEKNRERGAVQIPACLSGISRGAWYELGLKTEIELHLEECDDCLLRKALTRLDHNVGMASEWLEASGQKAKISYISQNSIEKTKRNLKATETGLKVTSRRDLFLSLATKGRQAVADIPVGLKNFATELEREHMGSLLPDWQKRLAKVYPQNAVDCSNPAYWPTIRKSEECISCGMCSAVCPSETLRIVVNNNICSHYFTSGICLDCRICQLFCPKEAISRDREKVEKPFEVMTIFTAPIVNCKHCGSFTLENKEQLCYWCKREAANDDSLREVCRNLFLKMES